MGDRINVLFAYYSSRRKVCERLGVTRTTLNSWINTNRRRFLQYLPEFNEDTDLSYSEIVELIDPKRTDK